MRNTMLDCVTTYKDSSKMCPQEETYLNFGNINQSLESSVCLPHSPFECLLKYDLLLANVYQRICNK